MGPLNEAGVFLISTLFDLYLFLLAIRLVLAFARADYHNPITQFIIRFTNPIVLPVRRFLPNFRGIELATLGWILLLEMIKFYLILTLEFGMPHLLGVLVLSLADFGKLIVNTFFYAIFLQVILSWIQPPGIYPIDQLLRKITDPIMRPLRRIVPTIGGFDITPIPALIILQLIIILLLKPIWTLGTSLAFG